MSTTTNEPVNNHENGQEAPISGEKDVRRGANDKVPAVSRMGKSSRKRNNRDALPALRSDAPAGAPEKVQEDEDPLVVRPISALNPVQKIELLNAYKALYEDIPPSADDQRVWIYNILKTGYQAWVNERIQELFGEGKTTTATAAQFTESEVVSLKALAQAVQQKKQTPTAPAQSLKGTPPPPRQPAQPVNTSAYIKSQEDFLQQLAKLDREGPEF